MKKDILGFNKIIYLKHVRLGEVSLELGKHYWIGKRYVRFIKVTRKGFNFLDEETSKCFFNRHIYAKGYANKDIPFDEKKFVCRMNSDIIIRLADVV